MKTSSWLTVAGAMVACVTALSFGARAQRRDDAGVSARDAGVTVGARDAGAVTDASATTVCPDDLAPADRAGHCCITEQRWANGRCDGAPTVCPPGRVIAREDGGVTCAPRPCESPLQRASDGVHCCFVGQTFNAAEQRCTGASQCPAGTERVGRGECVPRLGTGAARAVGARPNMQWIPGGTFEMGPRGSGRVARVSPYWIDRTEVTASEFQGCVRAGACEALSDPFGVMRAQGAPAVNVTHTAARAYCAWRGARLPSEAEWEFAARGSDGRLFPWGDRAPDCALSRGQGCGAGASAVGTHPQGASPFGVMDLSANVAEWVMDRSGPLSAGFERDPRGAREGDARVVRGGSFVDSAAAQRATARTAYEPTEARGELGFRCARGE